MLHAINEIGCLAISTGKLTYWPTDRQKIPDLIDFFLIKNISPNYVNIEEGSDMNSDHSPILLTLHDRIIQLENNPYLVNKNTDWDGFKHEVSEKIELKGTVSCIDQLEEEVEKFIVTLQQASWNNTPVINKNAKGRRYPKEIMDFIVTKRKIRKKWQQTRCPDLKKN